MICTKSCANCKKKFEISQEDKKLYEKCNAVEPSECFDCRQQHLMMFVNHINLYQRRCDATGEQIISNYAPDTKYKVFKMQYWWSNTWDAAAYGRDFDFNRPFFDQFHELSMEVPRPALFTAYQYDENSAYTNHSGKNKNCYMIFDSDENRDCYYSSSINKCNDCSDMYRSRKCELCYGCLDSILCYNSAFLQNSSECRDSAFLDNCRSCKNCFMCVNLNHREYFYKNEYIGPEEYRKLMKSLGSRALVNQYKKEFAKFRKNFPKRYLRIYKSENALGNYLVNCKNAYYCFDSNDLWDCNYTTQAFMPLKDCIDTVECGGGELIAMSATVGYNSTRIAYSQQVLDQVHECTYCNYCHFSSNLFGCVGLRRKKFHILNKKYEEKKYFEMVEQIIEHMKKTGEYGKFFPPSFSPFAYNESLAQQYYPLTKNEAVTQGWKWKDETDIAGLSEIQSPPDFIENLNEEDSEKIFSCANCKKKFRLTKEEIRFCKKQDIAAPNHCFKCRHYDRAIVRDTRKLQEILCGKCGQKIVTTTTNNKQNETEEIFCEKCFQNEIE